MVTIGENGMSCEDTIIAPEVTRNAPLVAYERQHTQPLGALAIFVANKV